jgi:hypothetical protein
MLLALMDAFGLLRAMVPQVNEVGTCWDMVREENDTEISTDVIATCRA